MVIRRRSHRRIRKYYSLVDTDTASVTIMLVLMSDFYVLYLSQWTELAIAARIVLLYCRMYLSRSRPPSSSSWPAN